MEIDALRGVAVLCMIFFHGAWDLHFLGFFKFEPYVWPWILPIRLVQMLFLGLVGVSIFLSNRNFGAQCLRGVKIFAAGLLVTFVTYGLFPLEYIRFGVLHCIALAIPVVALFKKSPRGAAVAAIFLLILSSLLATSSYGAIWSIPFGFPPMDFQTLDYFPLLPWLSVPLAGLFVASRVYAERRVTRMAFLAKTPGLCFLGRHALAIYLLHQPILYFSLWGLSSLWTHL